MTGDMRAKLHGYMGSLEHRFGDPEVYALQREAAAIVTLSARASIGGWSASDERQPSNPSS